MRIFKEPATRNYTFWHLQLNHGHEDLEFSESLPVMIELHAKDHKELRMDHDHTED